MALNLVRNSRVFFTTNVDPVTGVVPNGGFGPLNTFETQVLDGFSFSQNTNSETITITESGTTPVRGQNSFNTSLAPVDFSFSTYMRPRNQTTKITTDESVLWNALLTSKGITDTVSVTFGGGGAAGTLTATTGIAYNAGTKKLTITGSNLPVGSGANQINSNDTVVISGIVAATGGPSAQINGYGTVDAGASNTSITITLLTGPTAATTFTTTTATTFKMTKQGISQVVTVGSGGTGIINANGITYSFSALTGNGTLSIAGSSLPTFTKGDVLVITGLAAQTGASVEQLNQAAVVDTSSGTSLTLNLLTPVPGTVTFTGITTSSSFKLTKCAWAENGSNYSYVSTASSDIQQLQKFGLLFLVDNVMYVIDNCALNQASVDFAIDGIGTIAWTGQGSALRRLNETAITIGISGSTFSNTGTGIGVYGTFTAKDTSADCKYITNRLSLVNLKSINEVTNKDGGTVMTKDKVYPNLAITGGNLTINNNITYLTPAILGTVNQAATYYQGTRAISGSITAYLKTGNVGGNDTGQLLSDLLEASSVNAEVMMGLTLNIGGTGTPRVVFDMPGTALTIPTVDVQQVVSTNINFVAEGSVPGATTSTFDLTEQNDLTIRYYA